MVNKYTLELSLEQLAYITDLVITDHEKLRSAYTTRDLLNNPSKRSQVKLKPRIITSFLDTVGSLWKVIERVR